MSPRKRAARKRNFPENLYERNGYYSWRNPLDGREHGLGRIKSEAFIQATEANIHVAGLTDKARLVDRLTGNADRLFGRWMDRYEALIEDRDLSENTRKTYKSTLKIIRSTADMQMPLVNVKTLHIAQLIETVQARGHNRTAQAMRSRLSDIFRCAIGAGWIDRNPVDVTDNVKVKVTRARLSFEAFQAAYRNTDLIWLRNAMALALITGQRREDLTRAQFTDVRDGYWWCKQAKTGSQIMIPLDLRLNVLEMSIADVIKQCRGTGILSKYLIHQTQPRGNSPIGSQIWKDTLSRRFSDEIAKLSGFGWGANDRPTFHEIRSLSERMYSTQGGVNTQNLLGHKDAKSTARYHDSRGTDWMQVMLSKK